jgi:GT2 family glycosyltransferase
MTPESGARVAVVIPAYNLARYLGEAIESVLAQSLPPDLIEICVVDDGSTDDTPAIAQRYGPRVRYLRQTNRGLPATRNAGIRATRAPYLAFLDADDRLLPEKFAFEVPVLEADASIDIVYAGVRYIDAAGRALPQRGWSRASGDVLPELVLGNLIHPHAALVRRWRVEQVGGFDETLTSVEDWDLWLRMTIAGARWHCVDRPLLEYRVRDDGMHANAERMLRNRLRVLDKAFAATAGRADIQRLRPRARQQAYLEAACDHYRAEEFAAGSTALGAAVQERPELLVEPRALRQLCRLLLPLGFRNEAQVIARWGTLGPVFRRMLADAALASPAPDLRTAIARWVAGRRVVARYRGKQIRRVFSPQQRRRGCDTRRFVP